MLTLEFPEEDLEKHGFLCQLIYFRNSEEYFYNCIVIIAIIVAYSCLIIPTIRFIVLYSKMYDIPIESIPILLPWQASVCYSVSNFTTHRLALAMQPGVSYCYALIFHSFLEFSEDLFSLTQNLQGLPINFFLKMP